MSRPFLVSNVGWFSALALILSAPIPPLFAATPPRLDSVTFSKDVAPILFKHCASCHRPGEIGPFSLLTFKDAAKRANFLKEITREKRMPPWKPVHGYGDFQDERRLSDTEIKTLARWANSGAKEGNAKDLPPAPKFMEGWQLGTPDLILKMPEPFTIPPGGKDIFCAFVIPTGLKEGRTVAAVEFRPGNRRVVHHARFYLDNTGVARKKDEADPGRFRTNGGSLGINVTGYLGGWVPGMIQHRLPDGVGRWLMGDSDLIMEVHYIPTGKEEKDQSTFGIFFAKKPARQYIRNMLLVEVRLRIPAGEKRHRVTGSYTMPLDVHAVSIAPHMHLLGREMKVTATLPGGKKKPMIWIKDWDFNWQGRYQFKQPFALPKGTLLEMEAFFDNSVNNPKNPNNPPKTVWSGQRTKDEMCEWGIQIVVDNPPRDRPLLIKELRRAALERRRLYREWVEKGRN